MSKIELLILILAASIPFFALIFILPKNLFKKIKEKKTKTKDKKKEPIKEDSKPAVEEEPKEEPKIVEKPKQEVKNGYLSTDLSTDDFRSYLKERPEITRPKRVEHDESFVDQTAPYIPERPIMRPMRPRKPQNLTEEIQSLSPELKALIITGILDRKF